MVVCSKKRSKKLKAEMSHLKNEKFLTYAISNVSIASKIIRKRNKIFTNLNELKTVICISNKIWETFRKNMRYLRMFERSKNLNYGTY